MIKSWLIVGYAAADAFFVWMTYQVDWGAGVTYVGIFTSGR